MRTKLRNTSQNRLINEMEKAKIDNVVFEEIDHKDYPDYADAYIASADYDGVPMTPEEIEALHPCLVRELLEEFLH